MWGVFPHMRSLPIYMGSLPMYGESPHIWGDSPHMGCLPVYGSLPVCAEFPHNWLLWGGMAWGSMEWCAIWLCDLAWHTLGQAVTLNDPQTIHEIKTQQVL